MQSAMSQSEHEGGARLPVRRMVIVALASLAIVGAAAMYPLVTPIRNAFPPVSPMAQTAAVVSGLAWLATLLVAMARQPEGRLWKLIFAYIVTDRIAALEFVPDSLVWSVAVVLESLGLAVFVHLILAFPSGHLRDRFDRRVVLLGYALIVTWSLSSLLFGGEARFACDPECVRNLFVIWPEPGLLLWIERGLTVVAVAIFFPLVLIGLWRHWRDAGTAGSIRSTNSMGISSMKRDGWLAWYSPNTRRRAAPLRTSCRRARVIPT
jgi:hypothetical protein